MYSGKLVDSTRTSDLWPYAPNRRRREAKFTPLEATFFSSEKKNSLEISSLILKDPHYLANRQPFHASKGFYLISASNTLLTLRLLLFLRERSATERSFGDPLGRISLSPTSKTTPLSPTTFAYTRESKSLEAEKEAESWKGKIQRGRREKGERGLPCSPAVPPPLRLSI